MRTLERVLADGIRDIPDYPKPGVVFKDITPLLADHTGFTQVVEALAAFGKDDDGRVVVDKVVGIEARGFILAAPVALALGAGFVPVRKKGKLPAATYEESYALEYGEATIEVHQDAFVPGDRVLVIDDVLATGGTVEACLRLIRRCDAKVIGTAVLLELSFLPGRERLQGEEVSALVTV
ncbi:adenine phosphoribosyltransferase [Kribbella solani]|uniref:Adenine phosphoribosyltransferase n=1 Tax=Kribbella solani TaxID=236067 RepID=A0A841DI81_9ACTN|nr:adenine phosphoribosyltransferase [Kribbella solani]MBB5977601.1 adenine phosphoribosyltransferase [Kribbella solani]